MVARHTAWTIVAVLSPFVDQVGLGEQRPTKGCQLDIGHVVHHFFNDVHASVATQQDERRGDNRGKLLEIRAKVRLRLRLAHMLMDAGDGGEGLVGRAGLDDVDHLHLVDMLEYLLCLVKRHAVGRILRGIEEVGLQSDGKVGTYCLAHSLQRLIEEAGTVVDRTAIVVGTVVEVWREELTQQIAMGSMDLDAVEAGTACSLSGLGKDALPALNVLHGHLHGRDTSLGIAHGRGTEDGVRIIFVHT